MILTAITIVACAILYLLQSTIVDNYIYNELGERVSSADAVFSVMEERMANTAREVNADCYSGMHEAAQIQDIENLELEASWITKLSDMKGYVFTDTAGNILTSSYPNLNATEIGSIANKTIEKEMVQGCGTFIDGALCEYVATQIYNAEHKMVGILMLVGRILNDKVTLDVLKKQMGVEIYIMSDSECLATTDTTVQKSDVPVISQAVDSCLISKTSWVGNTEFMGSEAHLSCVPITDIFGNVKGIMMMRFVEHVSTEVRSSLSTFILILIIVTIVVSLIMSNSVTRRLVHPIEILSKKVAIVAKGDLTVHIDPSNTSKEIDNLTDDINMMKHSINDVLKPIVEIANTIMSSVEMLTSASNNMSDSANRQAASLEEISSSMEEMGANIQQNTENAIQTNKISEEVNGQIDALRNSSSKSYEAIRNIANNIEAINELVMQTNILALNASVEAARAGEQGKGFSVVAKEVGRLAEQTHTTADDINNVATSSISEAEDAFNCVAELLPKIEKITNLIKEISAASIEQNSGVNQVNTAIMDLNNVTQENAANAEMIDEGALELQRMLKELQDAISIFKVKMD